MCAAKQWGCNVFMIHDVSSFNASICTLYLKICIRFHGCHLFFHFLRQRVHGMKWMEIRSRVRLLATKRNPFVKMQKNLKSIIKTMITTFVLTHLQFYSMSAHSGKDQLKRLTNYLTYWETEKKTHAIPWIENDLVMIFIQSSKQGVSVNRFRIHITDKLFRFRMPVLCIQYTPNNHDAALIPLMNHIDKLKQTQTRYNNTHKFISHICRMTNNQKKSI